MAVRRAGDGQIGLILRKADLASLCEARSVNDGLAKIEQNYPATLKWTSPIPESRLYSNWLGLALIAALL
jgi:hypothetical protein